MKEAVCSARCAGCFFQGRNTGTCDYIFVVEQRRPCEPGEKCTAFIPLNRKDEFMRKPNWDTEEGRRMWMAGKKDEEIADAFGISTGAVTSRRKKYWEQLMIPVSGKTTKPAAPEKEKFSIQGMEPVSPVVIQDAGADEEPEDPKEEKLGAGQYDFDFTGGLQVPADPAGAADPAPAGTEKPVLKAVCMPVPEKQLNIMDILAAATDHLNGIKAVCTAGAIQHLMYWRYPEDLKRARDHIDYLLKLLEG